jgi:7-carboxy-7-deazaguanine synthase
MTETTVRLTEIFFSVQGESSFVGLPTVFIRLTGCPLRCVYCDSAYAFEGGKKWAITDVINKIAKYPSQYVCVTGGEPLAQPQCLDLLNVLIQKGYKVSLETSGAMLVNQVNPEVARIIDFKTPSSGELSKNRWDNLQYLVNKDEIKFVIGDDDDFSWALSKVIEFNMCERVGSVLFSPVHDSFQLEAFAEKVIASGLPIRMQIQLHKFIWGDSPGH